MVCAAAEGMGARAMCRDVGVDPKVTLYVDASEAICTAQRKGLGKLRHLNTQALWIQDAVRERRVELVKVQGTPLADEKDVDPFDFIRMLAVARIIDTGHR